MFRLTASGEGTLPAALGVADVAQTTGVASGVERAGAHADDRLRALSWYRVFASGALEPAIRLAAWASTLLGREREAVEAVVRGRILGGSSRWRIGRDVSFVGPFENFRLGCDVTLHGRTYLNAWGRRGRITIGSHTHLDQFCVLYGQGGLRIGAECAIASSVIVYTQTNADTAKDGTPVTRQPTEYAAVEIGDACWLGAGARVIPGVRIAPGVHVAAGAVVTRSVDAPSVVGGVPARVLRTRP